MRLAGSQGNRARANRNGQIYSPPRASYPSIRCCQVIARSLPGHCQVGAVEEVKLLLALKDATSTLGRSGSEAFRVPPVCLPFQQCPECLLRNRKDVFTRRPAYVNISLMNILVNSTLRCLAHDRRQSPRITDTIILSTSVTSAVPNRSDEQLTARTASRDHVRGTRLHEIRPSMTDFRFLCSEEHATEGSAFF